ncbi:MAG: type III PLP-dependent enzyme [Candidatus Micrarchaeota archaeon]
MFTLDFRSAKKIVSKEGSPVLVISEQQLVSNYWEFKKYLGSRVKVHYAVKANSHKGVLNALRDEGASFDVASFGEIQSLLSMGVDATRMVFANPVKMTEDIIRAYNVGVDAFMFDNDAEINKMARYAPDADVILRVFVSNDDAYYKLSTKFGAKPDQAIRLCRKARKMGLNPIGLTFSAGCQVMSSKAYLEGISTCRKLFKEAKKEGLNFKVLDMGGGYPVAYNHSFVDPKPLMQEIRKALDEHFPESLGVEIWAEPGRFICGNAAVLITSVIGKSKRNGVIWYYLDDGYYHDLADVPFSKWKFDFLTSRRGKKHLSVLAGPSCDSFDVITRREWLPELELDDLLLVPSAGAYSNVLTTRFNGFDPAKIVFIK